MAQNRPPPAYQEYAAAMMAKVEYRILNLNERGLLYSMRLECWVNQKLPKSVSMLSKILGIPEKEVSAALPSVMPFFAECEGWIICPELEDYRSHIASIREKQSVGGKRGAATTNGANHPTKKKGIPARPSGNSRDTRPSTRESLVQHSPNQSNQTQSSEEEIYSDPWLKDYEAASNGA